MARALTPQKRARRYLQASMESGYTGLPKETREAKQALMRSHEREYPRVRAHALAGSRRHFDEPLTAGEREHQQHLRRQEGLTEHDIKQTQRELDDRPRGRVERARESAPSGASAAKAAAGAATGALGGVTGSSGNTLLYFIGVMLGLSLIYLLVAGKGAGAVTGIVNAAVGGVRAFIAPVDPIATLERSLGASVTTGGASSAPGSTSVSPAPGTLTPTSSAPGARQAPTPGAAAKGVATLNKASKRVEAYIHHALSPLQRRELETVLHQEGRL